jgi:Pyridoxamine 5'-phosphate oxidase
VLRRSPAPATIERDKIVSIGGAFMSLDMTAAGRFLAALKAGDAAALAALLDEHAGYRQLNLPPLAGRDAIAARLVAADTGKIYRDASWRDPVAKDGKILLQGTLPKDAPLSSVTLTLQGTGTTIALVQHQTLPSAPPPPTPLKLPPDLKRRIDRALSEFHTVSIVYNDLDDQPVMSMRGSTLAFSDTQLAMWIRNPDGNFIKSIARRPKVLLYYRDDGKRATYQFRGRARVDNSDATRKHVYEAMEQVERDHDFAATGVAVVIDLDWVEGWAGAGPGGFVDPIRMARGGAEKEERA